ncbi:MAG TPA: N-acetyltransferase [Acidimicrobiia bacterium]|nr:N-acetyltransferase [Acidimicrobiia bacterium]
MSDARGPESLETGWLAGTPAGDTLLRRYVLANAEWMEAVARASGRPVLRTDDLVVVDEHSPHLLMNTGILVRPVEPGREEAIVADLAEFFTGGDEPYSLFCPWPTDLAGLVVVGHPPLMLRPAASAVPPVPPGLEIAVATVREELDEYEQVLVDGFPLAELQPWRSGVVFHPANLHVPGVQFFVGRAGGRAVTVAMSIVGCGVNHVEFVATMPDARGRGYGEAVTWAATMAAPELPSLLIASDMGRPVYERMGYLALVRWTLLVGRR